MTKRLFASEYYYFTLAGFFARGVPCGFAE